MAKVKSIVVIDGPVGDFVFYRMKGVRYVRRKDVNRKQRIAHLPNFERVRESNREFGHCSSSGKLLRTALAPMLSQFSDNRLAGRIVSVMTRIKDLDTISSRGRRNVTEGLKLAEGKLLLEKVDFNTKSPLHSVLQAQWQLDRFSGILRIPDFIPDRQLSFPLHATHATFLLTVARVNFTSGDYAVSSSRPVTIPKRSTAINLFLIPEIIPEGEGSLLYVLGISFFQEINGEQFQVYDKKKHVLSVIKVM